MTDGTSRGRSGSTRGRGRDLIRKARKLTRLVQTPRYREALRRGVAATVEHDAVPFQHEFATVIDVGAGRGQFALFASQRFPTARMICFEPLPTSRKKLEEVVDASTRVRIYELAASSDSGTAKLHVAGDDDSSSLRPMTERQIEAFPRSRRAGSISVETGRLADIIPKAQLVAPTLLKIDVQGAELEALRGAEALLPEIAEVFVECSFTQLYEGQALAHQVICYLVEHGFALRGAFSLQYDRFGNCLEADLLFSRAGADSPNAERRRKHPPRNQRRRRDRPAGRRVGE